MKMKKIILIYPRTGFFDNLSGSMPYSLLTIAGALNKDYEFVIIDQRVDNNWKEIIKESVDSNTIAFGISSMTGPQVKFGLEVSKFLKEKYKIPIIWGGIQPTLYPKVTVNHPLIDYIVSGRDPMSFSKLLSEIQDLPYKEKKFDFNKVKFPFDLIKTKKYSPFNIKKWKSTSILTSIGCPYQCSYCINSVINNIKIFQRNSETIFNDIKNLYLRGFDFFYFLDDSLFFNLERLEKLLDLIIKSKIKIKWAAQGVCVSNFLKITDSLKNKIEKSGCHSLEFGIESFNKDILKLINKAQTVKMNFDLIKKAKSWKITKKYNFMAGFPLQNKQQIWNDTKKFLKILDFDKSAYVLLNIYMPYEGTKLFEMAKKYGYKKRKVLESFGKLSLGEIEKRRRWMSRQDQIWLRNLAFLIPFYNSSSKSKISKKEHLLFKLYQPIARLRLKLGFIKPLPEYYLARLISKKAF